MKYWSFLYFVMMILILATPYAHAEYVFVLRGQSPEFISVAQGFEDDIESEMNIVEMEMSGKKGVKDIAVFFNKYQPSAVLLLGNKAVELYAKYQRSQPNRRFPPAIITAALFVDKLLPSIKNSVGIRYEIPAVTSGVNMRSFIKKPIRKIGVIYREWMRDIIEKNAILCKSEGIELVGIELLNKEKRMPMKVRKALAKLNASVDVIWILNDNDLLVDPDHPKLIRTWITARKKSKLPAIVGIPQFIQKVPLGTFALVPDNYALGAQAAGLLFELKDNEWKTDGIYVKEPVSVDKYVNIMSLDRKKIRYNSSLLNQFDMIVK